MENEILSQHYAHSWKSIIHKYTFMQFLSLVRFWIMHRQKLLSLYLNLFIWKLIQKGGGGGEMSYIIEDTSYCLSSSSLSLFIIACKRKKLYSNKDKVKNS